MDHSGGNLTKHRKNIAVLWLLIAIAVLGLLGRLVFLMIFRSEHYSQMALELHQRERSIKAARGRILDAKGKVIADNRTVCTVSVIYNQVKDREKVTDELSEILGIDRETVQKKVEKRSSREIIKTNVDKETGDAVRKLELPGVKVDEDYKRYYPYGSLASKVLGFTGGDNQGVIGLEVQIDEFADSFRGVDREEKVEECRENLTRGGHAFGVYDGDRLVALAETTAENSVSAMVVGVATLPGWRGRGFARACVHAAAAHSFAAGRRYLCLFYDNPAAGRIYHALGFADVGRFGMAMPE